MIKKDFLFNAIDTPIHLPIPEKYLVRRPLSVSVIILACILALASCRGNAKDDPTPPDPDTPATLRIYVAGESIERRNHFVAPPFLSGGALNNRGNSAARNDNDEYGWMIPLSDRLQLRNPQLTIEFVGAKTWLDAEDNPYTGTYPSTTPGATSAISGTSIPSWIEQRRGELEARTHCYNVAFVARGGNDFGNDDDADFKASLKELVLLAAHGSNCEPNPRIYVTGHMPDDQRGDSNDPPDAEYVALQRHRYVDRVREAVDELKASDPSLRVSFIDMYTPFTQNQKTTAFPNEIWSTGGVPDFHKIGRQGDLMHPRRLASIYAGELVADAMDLEP